MGRFSIALYGFQEAACEMTPDPNEAWTPFRRAQIGEFVTDTPPHGISPDSCPFLEIASDPDPRPFDNRFSQAFDKGARTRMLFEWVAGKGWLRKA